MKTYTFNDKQGNRDRKVKACLIYNGQAHPLHGSPKLAQVVSLSTTRSGKWSNTTWRVTVNTAKLAVVMPPFEGWVMDLKACIAHVVEECKRYSVSEMTWEDAEIVLRYLYPSVIKRIDASSKASNELL